MINILMFEYLSQYKVILVSGGAYTGTTICRNLIQSDLPRAWEAGAATDKNWSFFKRTILSKGKRVIKYPQSLRLSEFGDEKEIAGGWSFRDIEDVLFYGEKGTWNGKGWRGVQKHGIEKISSEEWQRKPPSEKREDLRVLLDFSIECSEKLQSLTESRRSEE